MLLLFGIAICLLGSATLIFDPRSENPLTAQVIGAVMSLICLWLASVAIRLIFNMKSYGGLLSPLVLRLVAIYAVAFPIFLIVTGRSTDWPFLRYVLAASYIFGGIGLWRLAARRKASNIQV